MMKSTFPKFVFFISLAYLIENYCQTSVKIVVATAIVVVLIGEEFIAGLGAKP